MADDQENNTEKAESETPPKQPLLSKKRLVNVAVGLGGMILGSMVGMGVQMGVQSTGLLGPSVQAMISEQGANFDTINTQLAEIRSMTQDPEVRRRLTELANLLERQGELSQQANAELSYLGGQVEELKQQQLAENGFAGGADFWLKRGESVTVGGEQFVFSLLGARLNIADINLNGERQRMTVGDVVPITGVDVDCNVTYKLATPRADGRVGFDINCG